MRKAGDVPLCCQEGAPEVFSTIQKHLKTDGVPEQAANQMTAEMLTHGEDFDSSVENYQRYYENYKEKGFSQDAAQALAVEALEGREPEPKESIRFARIHLP